MEKKTIEVIVGKATTGTVDPSKIASGVAVAPKSDGEVGGRVLLGEYVQCPSCGAINYIIESSDEYNYYRCWNDGYVFTAPVGSFASNGFALSDMIGNVLVWTQDCWMPDYTGAPSDGSAREAPGCPEHEVRGGSWFSPPPVVKISYRNHFQSNYRTSSIGVRLVREMD